MSARRPAKRARHRWETEIATDPSGDDVSLDTPRFGEQQNIVLKCNGAIRVAPERKSTGILKRLSWGLFGGGKAGEAEDEVAESDDEDSSSDSEDCGNEENETATNVTSKETSPIMPTKSVDTPGVQPLQLIVDDVDAATGQPTFTYLPDFASKQWGAKVIFVSDEFFGRADNLLVPSACLHRQARPSSIDLADNYVNSGTAQMATCGFAADRFTNDSGIPGAGSEGLRSMGPFGATSDGWQTRRRRHPGHDWVVIQLAEPICLRGITLNMHCVAQMAPSVSIEGGSFQHLEDEMKALVQSKFPEMIDEEGSRQFISTFMNMPYPQEAIDALYGFLDGKTWTEILPITRIRAHNCHENHFAISAIKDDRKITHIRLNIYPDGGIARFRAYGEAPTTSAFLRLAAEDQPSKTISLLNPRFGGGVLWASSSRDCGMANLVLESSPQSAADGWRTQQQPRRPPILFADAEGEPQYSGDEFVVLKCAARCLPKMLRIDTEFFLGDAPAYVKVEVVDLPEIAKLKWLQQMEYFKASGGRSLEWQTLIPKFVLRPHARHELALVQINKGDRRVSKDNPSDETGSFAFGLDLDLKTRIIKTEIQVDFETIKAMTHLKITIVPDGSLSRVSLMGQVCDVLVTDLSGSSRSGAGNAFVTGALSTTTGISGTGSGACSARNRSAIRRRSAALLKSSLQNTPVQGTHT